MRTRRPLSRRRIAVGVVCALALAGAAGSPFFPSPATHVSGARLELRAYASSAPRGTEHIAVYPGAHSGAFWDEHEDDWTATAVQHLSPPA